MRTLAIFFFGMIIGIGCQRIAGDHVDTLIDKTAAAVTTFRETN